MVEFRAIGGEEFGVGEACGAGAGGGFVEFCAADIGSDEADVGGRAGDLAEGVDEGFGFAAGPAGEVEDGERAVVREGWGGVGEGAAEEP